MAKKKSAGKSASAAKKKPAAGAKRSASKSASALAKAKPPVMQSTGGASGTQASAAHRVFGFTFDVGPSYDGDLIVEVPYPRDVVGEVVAVFFQPARDAGGIPDDWTEQHAVQVLRFGREPGGTATVRIHRIDAGWIGQGWVGNLVLHVLVAMQ